MKMMKLNPQKIFYESLQRVNKMKYIWILLLTPLLAQTTFTEAEALEMIKARDAQWEGKLAKADSLIESQKVTIADSEKLILELEEYSKVESVLSEAKSKQITLLKEREPEKRDKKKGEGGLSPNHSSSCPPLSTTLG